MPSIKDSYAISAIKPKATVLLYLTCVLFLAVNSYLIYNEIYWGSLLPVALILLGISLLALDKLLLLIVFFTPLSVNLEQLEFGLGLSLPTEPLMFGAMIIFLIRTFYERDFDNRVLRHPVTIAVFIYLFWLSFTVITSELKIVSLKHVVAKLWFIICFYFIATRLFAEHKNIQRFIWLFIIPLCGVVVYTLIMHGKHGFEEKPAHWVMQPFFKDHTSYGAILAMFYPFILGTFFLKNLNRWKRALSIFAFAIITAGLVFSYTRAAWISLVIVLGVFFIYFFRIKFSTLAIAFTLLVTLFLYFQNDIIMSLEKNRQDSSTDLAEHAQSVTNIASDASNLERINRWNCALRMFMERPVFGWGPGTYQFLYSPYQHSGELTIISTKFGNRGNAHSEYLGPLAEAGVLGTLTFLAIIICIFYTASRLYARLVDPERKIILLTTILGFTTYIIHGVLNNFLDTDKAAVPFWGFAAIIVALDVFSREKMLSDNSKKKCITKNDLPQ